MACLEHDLNNPWLNVSRRYHVHIESVEYTNQSLEMNIRPYSELSIQEARAQEQKFAKTVNGTYLFDGSLKEFEIPTSNHVGGITVSVYMPAVIPAVPAILIYFHGGGLMTGSRATNEHSLQRIVEQSGTIIVNVEYRLLPCSEDPFAPFTDAMEVTDWVMKNKEAVGGSSESAVGIGGDSAGGQIACSVTESIEGLDYQILIYPTVTDLSSDFESCAEFRDIPVFNTKHLEWRMSLTNSSISNASTNSRLNILARTNLELSPPTLVILAQIDPLRDAILLYIKKLKSAGVHVQEELIDGVPRGFFSFPGIFKSKTAEAFALIVDFLKTYQQ